MLVCQKEGYISNDYPESISAQLCSNILMSELQWVHYVLLLLAVRDRDDESQ